MKPETPDSPRAALRTYLIASVVGLFVGMAFLAFLAMNQFPIEAQAIRHRYEMWRAGAKSVAFRGLRGLELDRCAPGGEGGSECHCVLLLHGLGDEVGTWRKLYLMPAESWQRKTRLLGLDLPGQGGSDRTSDYRVSTTASLLLAELEASAKADAGNRAACTDWTIVGNSLGGWVALHLARQIEAKSAFPLRGVLLLDPVGIRSDLLPPTSIYREELTLEQRIAALKDFQRRAYWQPRELPEKIWKAVAEKHAVSASGEIAAAQDESQYLNGRLRDLRAPVVLSVGEADQITPPAYAEAFAREFPEATFKLNRVEKCGHLPQKECPVVVYELLARMVGL